MKKNDFADSLTKFFEEFLMLRRGISQNTIKSYRDTFKLLLIYLDSHCSIKPEKITLSLLTVERINDFAQYLSQSRNCCGKTINQRMAALKTFARFLQYEYPEKMSQWQQIRVIPRMSCPQKPVEYLTQDELTALFSVIHSDTKYGLRDRALILLLYDTGARVQEIVNLSVDDISFGNPSRVTLFGKGRKTRIVPIMKMTGDSVKEYMENFGLTGAGKGHLPIFSNRKGGRLTRFGVSYLLDEYSRASRAMGNNLPNVSPHVLRHSKAMHLLEEGCPDVVIQRLLGHADIKTTGIYAKANQKMLQEALEKVKPGQISSQGECSWQKDKSLLAWLNDL